MGVIGSPGCRTETKILELATQQIFPAIEQWIPASLDRALAKDSGDWHFDVLTPSRILRLELLQACGPQQSFQQTLREVWHAWSVLGSAAGPLPSSAALAQARARLPSFAFEYLFKHTAKLVADIGSHPLCAEHRLLTIDGIAFNLPNTLSHSNCFGRTSTHLGPVYYPQANGVWIAQLPGRGVLAQHLGPASEGDQGVGPRLLPSVLRPDDLVLADSHYAGYPTQTVIHNAHAYYLVRASGTFIPEKHRVVSRGDHEVELEVEPTPYVKTYHKHLDLPPFLRVRCLYLSVPSEDKFNGVTSAVFLTNLPRDIFPIQRLHSLVGLRWNQETIHNDIKTRMGLGEIRSKTADGARREILAHLCCANMLRLLLHSACGPDLSEASFTAGLSALREANTQLRLCPKNEDRITSVLLNMIREQPLAPRPGRSEPRLIRPHRRVFDTFRSPRSQWRKQRNVG